MALGDWGARFREASTAVWLVSYGALAGIASLCSCGSPPQTAQVGGSSKNVETASHGGDQASRRTDGTSSAQRAETQAGFSRARDEVLPALLHPVRDTSWLGVELKDLERGVAGVRVERVFRGSPAYRVGLEPGDVLLALDGEALSEPSQVNGAVRQRPPGARVGVLFERGGQRRLLPIELGNLPEAEDLMRLHFVGLQAPALGNLEAVQGAGAWGWRQLEGKVVVLEFWARWCGVCRYLVPVLNRWHQRYRPQGVTLLGVTSDSVRVADRAVRELGVAYAVASDASGETSAAFAANQIPTVFVVDRRGVVRDVMVGLSERRLRDLEELVEELLATPMDEVAP